MFASLTRFPRPLPGRRQECPECLSRFPSSCPLPVFVEPKGGEGGRGGGGQSFNSLLFEEQTATFTVMAVIGLNNLLLPPLDSQCRTCCSEKHTALHYSPCNKNDLLGNKYL